MPSELDMDLFATTAYRVVADYFDITSYRPTGDYIIFWAGPLLHKRGWRWEMNRRLAQIRGRARIERDNQLYKITITPLRRALEFPPLLNTVLFLATFVMVVIAAALQRSGTDVFSDPGRLKELALHPDRLLAGLPFALALLTILVLHEMGHFWAGYRRGIIMSYPYFIPAPTFLGTFGAVIKSRSPISNRRNLILVGAAGPLAGAVPAVIALVWGYALSGLVPQTGAPLFTFGNSILTWALQQLFFGDIPAGMTIAFSPLALAGKAGLLVTMLNLLPLGQLDGGHIIYGLWGKRQHQLAVMFLLCLLVLGFFWPGWWVWMALAILMRPMHPPVIDKTGLPDRRHRLIGWAAVLLFIMTFAPLPVY